MRPVFILSIILLLVGCKQRDERVLMVDEQGSFAIGGTVLVDSLGHTYHGDHAYVFYQKPVGARKYPLVFAHGVGQFSKTWETTPDGREGFQNIFLRCGFSVYLVDQPRRGNAGRGTESVTISPAFDEEVWFNRFRVGIWPDYFEGVQFKRDKETLDQYFRQMTPTIGTTDFEVYSDAYAALFDKIGPGVFITHSQGGPVGWNTLLKTRNIKAIASYEPGGAVPFPEGQLPEHFEKLVKRELERLRLSYELAVAAGYTSFIQFLHYPPTSIGEEESGFTRMALEYGANQVIYAHCHGKDRFQDSFLGNVDGVNYRLVSSDYLKFKPERILP